MLKELIVQLNPQASNYKEISLKDLQSELSTTKGAKFISLTTITVPDLSKDCSFRHDLFKVSYVNGIVNFHYETSVNNQREREGKEKDFEAMPRKWGTRLKDTPFVSHVLKSGEHKLYLEVKIEKSLEHSYFQPSTRKIVPNDIVSQYLTKKSYSNQGVEKEIILRDYDVKNILTISFDGNGYLILENIQS